MSHALSFDASSIDSPINRRPDCNPSVRRRVARRLAQAQHRRPPSLFQHGTFNLFAPLNPARQSDRPNPTQLDGTKKITTETGAGQWGSSLAWAGAQFGVEIEVYQVKVSMETKPYRKAFMEAYGAKVFPSPSDRTEAGRAILGWFGRVECRREIQIADLQPTHSIETSQGP